MSESRPRITRLPSQASAPQRKARDEDQRFKEQQQREAWEEAYLIDGWQPSNY